MKGKIEAILFSLAEPISVNKLSSILDISRNNLSFILSEMQSDYSKGDRGIILVEVDDTVQLATKKEHYEIISKFNSKSKNKGLSNYSLEILAIIAYRQPITKAEIDAIRGVSSDGGIQTLLTRELIEVVGKLEKPGRPIQYGTTLNFLRVFGLNNLEQLPPFEELPLLETLEDKND